MKENKMNCSLCQQTSSFAAMAVRVVDGDLLADANYCRAHALEVVLGRSAFSDSVTPWRIGDYLDQCYQDRCDCLPAMYHRCARCTRLADVWLTAGTDEDLRDLDRGILLCGPCALADLGEGTIPEEVRRELRDAVKS